MIKVRALDDFYLSRYDEIKNLVRYQERNHREKTIEYKDTFECSEDLANYLLNKKGFENPINKAIVEIVEVIPEIKEEEVKVEEQEEVKKPTVRKRRKTTTK